MEGSVGHPNLNEGKSIYKSGTVKEDDNETESGTLSWTWKRLFCI